MNKEFIYIASSDNIKSVHIGIFPSYGRYFRRQMIPCGEGIFRIEMELPQGEVYFHYFLNEDFKHPHSNILEELVAKDDPLKLCSFFVGTKPFCALEFNNDPQFISQVSQGRLTLRAITHYTNIESLILIIGESKEIPFEPLFQFRNQTYWIVKLDAHNAHKDSLTGFSFKLRLSDREFILHKNDFGDLKEIPVEINQRTITPSLVGYQIFPDRFFKSQEQKEQEYFSLWHELPGLFSYFGGNIPGIIEKLPYLNRLGIDFIYLNPVFYAGTSHRYDTIDYYRIDPILGENDDFKNLVEKAHELSISIILDIALNHSGVDFFAFKDILENQESSKYCHWYYIHNYPVQINDKHNYDSYEGHKHMPEFNLENPEVIEYLINAVLFWLKEFDVDGFRIDTCSSLPIDFLRELVRRIREIKSETLLIGEYWHSNAVDLLENTGIDAITNYSVYWEVVRPIFEKTTYPLGKAAAAIMDWYYRYTFQQTSYCWNFLDNHDLPRLYSIMHDKRWYKMAIALVYALPGTPVIYYGSEIPMEGINDPDNRRCMDWSRTEDVERNNTTVQSLTSFYRFLNGLRKKHAAVFETGILAIPYLDETQRSLVLLRFIDGEALCFIFNFGEEKLTLHLPEIPGNSKFPGLWLEYTQLLEIETQISINPYEVKFLHWRRRETSKC